ncbi:MAG: hypothetical protein U0V87_17625 [Acidobacteriota bacterium]
MATISQLGHTALKAHSTSEAKQRLSVDTPQVVLISSTLGLLDALELVRSVREASSTSPMFAVFTGQAQGSQLDLLYEAGLDADLPRPASAPALRARLKTAERWLFGAPARQPAQTDAPHVPVGRAEEPTEAASAHAASEFETVCRSKAWANSAEELRRALSQFLSLELKLERAEIQASAPAMASGIILANVGAELEIRIALGVDSESAKALAVHLFGEASDELAADMLCELANLSMGALKTACSNESLHFTGSLPEVLTGETFDRYCGTCERQELFALIVQGKTLIVRVGIRSRRNVLLVPGRLKEGMVLAKDLFNARGILLTRAGTRLSSTMVERLQSTLPNKQPIEVSPGEA